MRKVQVVSGREPFRQTISVGPHRFDSDESEADGGADAGPEPHELLLSALGACTAMTIRLYARKKGWPLERVRVSVVGERNPDAFTIRRTIAFSGNLTPQHHERLLSIAEKCPVHRTLTGTIRIETTAELDKVDEAGVESFPASDPPSWTLGEEEE